MRRVWAAVAAALLASVGAATALAAHDVRVSADKPAEPRIYRLLERSFRYAERDPGCRRAEPPRATFTDDPPSDRMLATLGILRRPQAANERLPDEDLRDLPIQGIYRGHVRVARSSTGRSFLLVPGRDINLAKPFPPRCRARAMRRLDRLLRGERASFKRRARRVFRASVDVIFNTRGRIVEGLYMFERSPDGRIGSGGGVSVTQVRRKGYLSVFGIGRSDSPARVEGLVPDGVASVTAIYPRTAPRIGGGKPRRYPSRVTRTRRVRDNVFTFVVPRAIQHAYPSRIVWRGPGGRVVKVIRTPG